MVRSSQFKFIKVKFKHCSLFFKISRLNVLGLLILSCSWLSGQIKPISVLPLMDRLSFDGLHGHPIILGNDNNGLFYLNYIHGDTLKFKRQSENSSNNFILTLKDFDVNNGLQHCIVKKNDTIILLNRSRNSIQCYDCKGNSSLIECTKLYDYKVELEKPEKLIRIEKDNRNVYLVSYNFKSRCQKFYLLNPAKNKKKLLYSNFNPFIEIFFLDDNVSNYSFYNNKLALTDFYSGNTLIVDLLNSQVIDTVKFTVILNKKRPSIGTFERLVNRYDKYPTMPNFDSMMNLVYNYNRLVNSFFLNDSVILIFINFVDPNATPFDLIAVNVSNQKAIFKQRYLNIKSGSETVKITNMPIYIGNEEANYIGDGLIYVYKEMPELNKDDFGVFFNKMEQFGGSKIGTFIMYKYLPEIK